MPLIAKCDNCGGRAERNVARDPIVATRDKLTVRIEVVKSNGSPEPIICAHCSRMAAMHGVEHRSEAAA